MERKKEQREKEWKAESKKEGEKERKIGTKIEGKNWREKEIRKERKWTEKRKNGTRKEAGRK
jgi:hypothetical protein